MSVAEDDATPYLPAVPASDEVRPIASLRRALPPDWDGQVDQFAIVKLDGLRIFTILTHTDPSKVTIGQRVRLAPLRVADDPKGNARWLPAFEAVE